MMDITAIIDTDIAYGSDTPASITLQPGGVAANTAAWMALNGHEVTLVGCVGSDAFGAQLRDQLERVGISHHLQTGLLPTGSCMVIVDRRRERTMFPDAGANSELHIDAVIPVVEAGSHLHLSGYTLMNPSSRGVGLAAIEHAKSVGATLSIDPASAGPLRQHLALMHDVMRNADLILANEDEACVLTGATDPHEALITLASLVDTVVVKVGARGAMAAQHGVQVEKSAPAVEVIDTTGAGDAFTAGFLPAWLAHEELSTCVDAGQIVAARAVGRVGASPLPG